MVTTVLVQKKFLIYSHKSLKILLINIKLYKLQFNVK